MVYVNWTTRNTASGFDVVDGFFTNEINVATSGETVVYTHYRVENLTGDNLSVNLSNKTGDTALTTIIPDGESHLFVKTTNVGTPEWSVHINGGYIVNICSDVAGNLYVVGYSYGEDVIIRDLDTNPVYNNSGDYFAYVAKYTPNGLRDWVVQMNSTDYTYIRHVSVNAAGEVVGTGLAYAPSTFVATDSSTVFTTDVGGNGDIFIFVLTSAGAKKWFASLVGDSANRPSEVAFDADGNVYSMGIYNSDPITITDGLGGTNVQPGGGGPTVGYGYIVKFSGGGARNWFYRFDADSSSVGMLKLDVSNFGVYVLGIVDNLDVGIYDDTDTEIATIGHSGNYSLFVSKFSLDGVYQWSGRVDGLGQEFSNVSVSDRIVDSKGAVYIHGNYVDTEPKVYNNDNVYVGGLALETGGEFFSGFICKFDVNGVFKWITKIVNSPAGSSISPVWQIKMDQNDNLYITGNSTSEGPVPENFALKFYNKGGNAPVQTINTFANPIPTYVFSYSSEGNFRWITHVGDDSFLIGGSKNIKPAFVLKKKEKTIQQKDILGNIFSSEANINNRLSVTPKGKIYMPLTAGSPIIKLFINNALKKTLPEFSAPQPYLLALQDESDFSALTAVVVVGAVVLGIGALMAFGGSGASTAPAAKKPTA